MCGGTQNLSHASSRESFSEHHHGRGRTIRAVGCLVVAAFKTLIALAIYNLDGNTRSAEARRTADRFMLMQGLLATRTGRYAAVGRGGPQPAAIQGRHEKQTPGEPSCRIIEISREPTVMICPRSEYISPGTVPALVGADFDDSTHRSPRSLERCCSEKNNDLPYVSSGGKIDR